MINFQGVQGGVGYNDTASDQDSKRRQQLAQLMLQQSNAAPAVGWTGALNKVLAGAIAGYQMNKDGEEQKARGDAKNDTLARALQAGQGQAAETKTYGDGTTINWDERKADPNQMAAILAGNRDTAPMGLQMQLGQIENKQKNEAALATELRKSQLDRENEFWKPIKTEDGSIIIPALTPGFQMPGQAPRAQAPAPQAPGGGVDMRTASAAPNPPPVQQQPLAAAGEVPEMFQSVIGANAERTGLDPRLLGRVFMRESGGNVNARSPVGAQGPMQVMPGTQRDPGFGVKPAQDGTAEENFRVGSDYLAAMHQKYGGDTKLALMAYNWGPGNVDAWLKSGADPSKVPAETRNYVAGIAGDTQQSPAVPTQGGRVQVADASGAIPASVPAPGAPPNQPGVIYRSNSGIGGPFGGNGLPAQDSNLWIKFQTKLANGESLTPQEQLAMALIEQRATQPRTMMTDQGLVQVPGTPLPTIPGRQQAAPAAAPPATTDTVPNPMAPPAPPAPAQPPAAAAPPGPPKPTVIVPKAAKPLPEGIQKGMAENITALRKIEDAVAAITRTPDATGGGIGAVNQVMPNAVTNFLFPEGVNARALIADIGSLKLHDRSGANITASESPRLSPFIPAMSDPPDVIKTKLENFKREYINELNDMNSAYGAESGYAPNLSVVETIKNGRTPRYTAPLSGNDPNQQKPDLSGHSNEDILKQLGM
jgi:soluble lytic murein transglycosylase-like protein